MKTKKKITKRVLITGASRGIGKEIAKKYFIEGYYVIGTATAKKSYKNNFCHEWHYVDFSNQTKIINFLKKIKIIKPDILINNAGINANNPFERINYETFKKIHNVNLFAPFLICQYSIPYMKKRKWGRIVNIASIWSKKSRKYRAAYASSKFGLDGLTISIAAEYTSMGILANCVSPGFINTELTQKILGKKGIEELMSEVPINRLGKPNEIAELVFWLGSEKNTFISAQNIAIDGGFTSV